MDAVLIAQILSIIVSFLLKWVFLIIVFFIAGRIVSGVNTTITDAIVVAFIGSLVSEIVHFLFESWLLLTGLATSLSWLPNVGSALITIIVYIPLFIKFFDTEIWGALAIGMLCVIIYIIVGVLSVALRNSLEVFLAPLAIVRNLPI